MMCQSVIQTHSRSISCESDNPITSLSLFPDGVVVCNSRPGMSRTGHELPEKDKVIMYR